MFNADSLTKKPPTCTTFTNQHSLIYMESLLLDTEVLLEKMQMKGGWTYALLPDVLKSGKKNFGWAKVNAFIDDYELKNASLMPIKGGRLFIAVKAEIRKQIGKEAGDTVRIKLYGNKPPEAISNDDFFTALKDDPDAYARFHKFPPKEQQAWVGWIFAGNNTDDIVERMATAIGDIAMGRFCKAMKPKENKA